MNKQQEVFEAVKNNKGITARALATMLGRDIACVSSELTLMTKRHLLDRWHTSVTNPDTGFKDTVFAYMTAKDEYVDGFTMRRQRAVRRAKKLLREQGVLVPQAAPETPKVEPAPEPAPAPTPVPSALDIDNMTVREARALYAQLQEFFRNVA